LQEEATSEVPKAEVVTSPAAVDHNSGEEENAVESQPAHKPGQKPTKQYALKRYKGHTIFHIINTATL
jgi:hypothetical protein